MFWSGHLQYDNGLITKLLSLTEITCFQYFHSVVFIINENKKKKNQPWSQFISIKWFHLSQTKLTLNIYKLIFSLLLMRIFFWSMAHRSAAYGVRLRGKRAIYIRLNSRAMSSCAVVCYLQLVWMKAITNNWQGYYELMGYTAINLQAADVHWEYNGVLCNDLSLFSRLTQKELKCFLWLSVVYLLCICIHYHLAANKLY